MSRGSVAQPCPSLLFPAACWPLAGLGRCVSAWVVGLGRPPSDLVGLGGLRYFPRNSCSARASLSRVARPDCPASPCAACFRPMPLRPTQCDPTQRQATFGNQIGLEPTQPYLLACSTTLTTVGMARPTEPSSSGLALPFRSNNPTHMLHCKKR